MASPPSWPLNGYTSDRAVRAAVPVGGGEGVPPQIGERNFADRDGVGVDRTRASGTGFPGQYPLPWSELYESVRTCPDELLLFFHHVRYGHVLHDGSTVIQHIYDTHFAAAEQAAKLADLWQAVPVKGLLGKALHVRVTDLIAEQIRSAREWRDQMNAYFWRKSGVPDQYGRPIDGRIQQF